MARWRPVFSGQACYPHNTRHAPGPNCRPGVAAGGSIISTLIGYTGGLAAASDPRTALAAQTIRFALGLPNPQWLAFEQVATSATEFIFDDLAAELFEHFSGVDVFTIDEANLGMPMRRKRVPRRQPQRADGTPRPLRPTRPMVLWSQRTMAQILDWPTGEMIRTRGNRRPTGGNLLAANKIGRCMTAKAWPRAREAAGERLTHPGLTAPPT